MINTSLFHNQIIFANSERAGRQKGGESDDLQR